MVVSVYPVFIKFKSRHLALYDTFINDTRIHALVTLDPTFLRGDVGKHNMLPFFVNL